MGRIQILDSSSSRYEEKIKKVVYFIKFFRIVSILYMQSRNMLNYKTL